MLALAATLLGASSPLATAAEGPGPTPESMSALRRMTDHVAGLRKFSVEGQATIEMVLSTGQKLQLDTDLGLLVERPNRLRATRKGVLADQVFQYDGESLSLLDPEAGVWASEKAPPTLEGMLDFAREELDIVAPAADLIHADAFERLTQDMESGFVVSENAVLRGQSCTHLAFRKPYIDIQVWILNGDKPLPLKYVLTTTDLPSSPQFSLTLVGWNTDPAIDKSSFKLVPPVGTKRIQFIRAGASPAPRD